MRITRARIAAAAVGSLLLASPAAVAQDPPPLEKPDITKMDYTPIGKYGPADQQTVAPGQVGSTTIPAQPEPELIPPTGGTYPASIFNPSGKYVAYDTDLFMSIHYPDRHPDDPAENTEQDPADDIPEGGAVTWGTCPPRPGFGPWGDCGNHQREYGEFFEATMTEILGDFGVEIKRYPFESPGAGLPRGAYIAASHGKAVNVAAVVPGTDHPEQTVLVSGHYDFTDSGPAAAWDSSEGHTQVMRMAAIMADYWRKTNTRPAVTVKFIPWDSEESGTYGSIDYVSNNIPPGEESKVRGYFNVDPCAGGYPANKNGVPGNRIPEVLQLANPEAAGLEPEVKARFEKFNGRALEILEEVFDNLDDTVGGEEVHISRKEAEAQGVESNLDTDFKIAVGGLALFSSDYANFEAAGIPVFNLFADVFGPKADPASDGTRPPSSEGLSILHTNNDNFTTINRLTSADPTGLTASEGWAKGMEMCAQLESWYMLQPEMAGAQTVRPDYNPPVAYFEALPNEAVQAEKVKFDAGGSYQYANVAAHQYVPDAELTYTWDFGDGSPQQTGKVVEHAYAEVGRYDAKLTVSRGNQSDSMTIPITVEGAQFSPPTLKPIAAEEAQDGTFPLDFEFDGSTDGLEGFAVEESRNFREVFTDGAEGELEAAWDAPDPEKPTVQKWQKSDSSTPKFRGDVARSGETSYWAGARPTDVGAPLQCADTVPPGGPCNADVVLQSKQPITLPTEDPELTYYSDFSNEGDDRGFVEVALVNDNPPEGFVPDFAIVDGGTPGEGPGGRDPQDIYDPSNPATQSAEFEFRRIDLSAYRGKKVLIRFRLQMGAENRAASQPAGWYIDDIAVRAGTFDEIGRTAVAEKKFTVSGRANGDYAYRVKGVYTGGVATAPSNAELAKVTAGGGGGPGGDRPGGTPPGGTPPGGTPPGGEPGCTAPAAFRRATARRRGRGLRFDFSRRGSGRVTVEVFSVSKGRRVTRFRRVARFRGKSAAFTWNGRRAGKRVPNGYYVVRYRAEAASGAVDSRRVAVQRTRGRFRLRKGYERLDGCATLRRFRLGSPVFGGTRRASLGIGFAINDSARVGIEILRGKRVVRRFAARQRRAGNHQVRLSSRRLKRGDYRVRITVTRGSERTRAVLTARRL